MPIAITDAHLELEAVARAALEKFGARAEARRLLDGAEESLPPFWANFAELGWLGLPRVALGGVAATVIPDARRTLVDLARLLLAAEAVGLARECTEMASSYAKERIQFGRPIAMFQAVKHHCANMAVATELATSVVWDAARAAVTGGDQLTYAAAVAATLAAPAADLCANLSTQVHGGIAITWEHDATCSCAGPRSCCRSSTPTAPPPS